MRSWSSIVCALKEMDESILAREIEMKYCRPTQGTYIMVVMCL